MALRSESFVPLLGDRARWKARHISATVATMAAFRIRSRAEVLGPVSLVVTDHRSPHIQLLPKNGMGHLLDAEFAWRFRERAVDPGGTAVDKQQA